MNTHDSYTNVCNETNVKYFIDELKEFKEFKEFIATISIYNKNLIIKYISENCIIPSFKFNVNIKHKQITYDDLLLQINSAIINGLKKDPLFQDCIYRLKLHVANHYVSTFDERYKNIINIKINKHKLFSKEHIKIYLNLYIHHEQFIFFCSSDGMLEIYGSKKDKFSYKLNMTMNIHGMKIPSIESLNRIIK